MAGIRTNRYTGSDSGGSGLRILELDGSPDVQPVTTIYVSNGTLTDDGGGTFFGSNSTSFDSTSFGFSAFDSASMHHTRYVYKCDYSVQNATSSIGHDFVHWPLYLFHLLYTISGIPWSPPPYC